MIYLHIQHRVRNYAKWKEGFDNHAAARQAGGATGEATVLRDVDAPNEITILLGWSSLETAKTFAESHSLKEAMRNAGVIGLPAVHFLEAADEEVPL